MERRLKFCPEAVSPLEARLVLHHGGTGHVTSVVVSGLHPQAQVLNSQQQSVAAELNQAFNSFTSDYDQARATYFASIEGVSNPGTATTKAFALYTKQRVSLLTQQIISSFLQSPTGTAHAHGEPPVLKTLISEKIINTTGADPVGSLGNSLLVNIPPPGVSAPTASLYSLSQDLAIETARDEVLNGTDIVNSNAFGVQPPQNYAPPERIREDRAMRFRRGLPLRRFDPKGRTRTTLVECLEPRDLLTLVVANIAPVAGTALPNNQIIATFVPSDFPGQTLGDFTSTINWGDGSVATPGNIVEQGGVYEVEGSHVYPSATPLSAPDTITVTVNGLSTDTPASLSAMASVNVTPAPVTLVGAMFAAKKGVSFTGDVADFTDANPFVQANNFSATINWGDGTPPTTGTIGSDGIGGFRVQGTHTYALAQSTPYITTITVDDILGPLSSIVQQTIANGTATVPAVTPVFSPIGQFIVTPVNTPIAASTTVGSFVYTYTPPAGSPAPVFDGSINWGDGHVTAIAPGQITETAGIYNITGTNTYTIPGKYPVSITVADQYGNSGSIASTAVVTGSIVNTTGTNISFTPGSPFTATVATFTDSNPEAAIIEPTALISWGDGHQTAGTVTGPDANGLFTVDGTFTYASSDLASSYPVTVSITGPGGETGQATSTAIPTQPPVILPISQPIVATANMLLPPTTVVGSFKYTPPAGSAPPSFSATINWGDGHVTQGQVVSAFPGGDIYNVEGANTYAFPGNYTVIATVADQLGNTATITSPAVVTSGSVVTATGTIIEITPGVPFTGVVATFTDTNPAAKVTKPTALIYWGDEISSPGTPSGPGLGGQVVSPGVVSGPDANGQYTVTGTNDYGGSPSGPFAVTVVITDPSGQQGTATTSAVVLQGLKLIGTTFAVNPDSPYTGTVATFTDPNPGASSSTPTATINWGNGVVTAGTVTGPDANGVYTVAGSIFYLTTSPTGSYPVTVTVTDSSGQMGMTTSTALMSTAPPAPTLTGGFDDGGEDGPFATSGYSDTDRPTFSGNTAAFALVQLYARPINLDVTLPLGQTIAGPGGQWTLGTGPLADGTYTISAIVTPAGSSPTGPLGLGQFIIDTVPPRVVGVSTDSQGHVYVKFQDDRSGMYGPSLTNTANYTFTGSGGATFRPTMAAILPNGGLPTDVVTVKLTINGKSHYKAKTLRITAGGISDMAGNTLGQDFHGTITQANGLASSNPIVKVKIHKPKATKHK